MFRTVRIGKDIRGDKLEEILIETAKEMGLNATSVDEFNTEYKLGFVREEKVYERTQVKLRKGIIPLADVSINKKETRNWFHIKTKVYVIPFGFAPKGLVEKYLDAVSKHI